MITTLAGVLYRETVKRLRIQFHIVDTLDFLPSWYRRYHWHDPNRLFLKKYLEHKALLPSQRWSFQRFCHNDLSQTYQRCN